MEKTVGRELILIDPLFEVCDKISRINGIYFLCIAVSNYSGFASFKEYNTDGLSSSLVVVSKGTSHGNFKVVRERQIFVLEGRILFEELVKTNKIIKVKLDMQGFDLSLLINLGNLLKKIKYIQAECFCINIYNVDNSCRKMDELLTYHGFNVNTKHWREECGKLEWSDVFAERGLVRRRDVFSYIDLF
jgi:hypothetical protein